MIIFNYYVKLTLNQYIELKSLKLALKSRYEIFPEVFLL
jgi:hypothetical protein